MTTLHPLIAALFPEIILLIGASAVLLLGLPKAKSGLGSSIWLALFVLFAALRIAWVGLPPGVASASLNSDSLVWFARVLTLGMGALLLLVNRHVPAAEDSGEFFALLLFSLVGVTLVAVANDLILLFLALELVSVPTYILVGLSRRDIRCQEATGKYFFLGAFAAALTLYGFSFLYGATGTMRLFGPTVIPSIAAALDLPSAAADRMAILGLFLALTGLLFKLAAVPLHFYVADVYQGAASPVAGLLGFVPKFAGFVAIIRLLSLAGWAYSDALFWLLWMMAAATMTVGNTLALMQQNVKRMLAYSGIAHSGYMLVGLVAGPTLAADAASSPMRSGLAALLFYIAVYGVMNLGAFAALAYFRKPGVDGEDSAETLDDLAGSARRHPWAALALAICVLSLMGFPPTGGFWGKLYIFSAAISSSAGTERHAAMIWLVVIGVLNSAIAAAYYLRIVSTCYLRKPAEGIHASPCRSLRLSLALCALIVLLIFIRPGSLFDRSKTAVSDIRKPALPIHPELAISGGRP